MTRQDFELIAATLADSRPKSAPGVRTERYNQWIATVKAFADALAADNPRFDRDRFIVAATS